MLGYVDYKLFGNMQDINLFYLNGNGDCFVVWGGGVFWGLRFDGKFIEFYDYIIVNYFFYEDNFVDVYDNGFNFNMNVLV